MAVPELPEVERVRRTLAPVMTGARFERVVLNRADLRQPFPKGFARRLRHQSVRALTRRGKYLLAELSSRDTLIMHLGMSGSFRVEPTAEVLRRVNREDSLERRHDHVIFTMSSGVSVVFNDPRRFGLMDLVPAKRFLEHAALSPMGPEPLSRGFHARMLAARCAGRQIAVKVALLDQRIVAGIGNIYASEALHLARLSPFRPTATLATAAGRPTRHTERLVEAIKATLRRAIALKETPRYDAVRFRVYDREGERCPTPRCGGTIARGWQAARSTFYCQGCQR